MARQIEASLPRVARGLHWAGQLAPPGGTLSEAAHNLGRAAETGSTISAQLRRIAATDDPYGEALVVATCWGLQNIADQARSNPNLAPATAQSWSAFLQQQVSAILDDYAPLQIQARVSQFNNAAQLAAINPRLAYLYADACVLGRRG